MISIAVRHGQPSYLLGGDMVRVAVTVAAGHMTADFRAGGREVSPFFVAPWWNEATPPDTLQLIRVLRGDFFCFPFGETHGKTANDCWGLTGFRDGGGAREMTLAMDLSPDAGNVEKRVRVVDGEPVVYLEHTVTGFAGRMPLGHHPILKLPDREGAGIIDMTPPVTGFTAPKQVEDPTHGGYSSLAVDREIADRAKVPTVWGGTVDLTRYPTPRGFEDLACFVSDQRKEFCFSSVSVPEEGWLYFQLKDPKVLAETLWWMSNGGRHFPPWSGRVAATLALEEVTGYFAYGREASLRPNPFTARGYPAACTLAADHPFTVRFIMGVVPIDRSFRGVADIVRRSASAIAIRGRGGESIDVRCAVDFLFA